MIEKPSKAWRKFLVREFKAMRGEFAEFGRKKNVGRIVREEVRKERPGKTSSHRDLNMLLYFVLARLVEANPHITTMNKKKLAVTLAHDCRLSNAIRLAAQNRPIQAAVWKQITGHALKQLRDSKCWKVFRMKKEKIQKLQEKAQREVQAFSAIKPPKFFSPGIPFLNDLHELNQKFLQEELGTQTEEMMKQFRLAYSKLEREIGSW